MAGIIPAISVCACEIKNVDARHIFVKKCFAL